MVWLFGVVWLFWLRVGLLYRVPAVGRSPQGELSRVMDRNFYYIGIAFFGIVNGLFNQTWLLFALIHAQILSPALLFGSVGLTLMFASLMVSTATIILGGIPAAIYERWVGAKEDSTEASLWIWLAGTGLLTLPGDGQFPQDRPLIAPTVRTNLSRTRRRTSVRQTAGSALQRLTRSVFRSGFAPALPVERMRGSMLTKPGKRYQAPQSPQRPPK